MLAPRWSVAAVAATLVLAACSDSTKTSSVESAKGDTPGITATELHVGVVYSVGWEKAGKDSGASTGAVGNMKSYYEALFADINESGGIHGRKIVPHYREADALAPDPAVVEQNNCAALTDDAKVAILLAPNRQTDNFRACFERNGAAYLGWGGSSANDDKVFEQFPHYAEAGSFNLTRFAPVLVDRMVDEGFLRKGDTIGVVLYDSPPFTRTLENVLKPALAEHGLRVAQEAPILMGQTAAELGPMNAQIQNAIVKFKNSKVDRVLFLQNGVVVPYLFMAGGTNQSYKPRYAITTAEGPMTIVKQVQASAFEGSIGFGWMPAADQGDAEWKPSKNEQRCLDDVRAGGAVLPDRLAQLVALAVCDQVAVMTAALEAGGSDLSSASFIKGLEKLGSQLEPVNTLEFDFGPGRHDGAGAIRPMKFESSCTCFRYTGGPEPIPE